MAQFVDLVTFGLALKEAREKRGLTQPYICKRVGAAGSAIYRWEAGKVRPQDRFLVKLRKLFPELPELPRATRIVASDEAAA